MNLKNIQFLTDILPNHSSFFLAESVFHYRGWKCWILPRLPQLGYREQPNLANGTETQSSERETRKDFHPNKKTHERKRLYSLSSYAEKELTQQATDEVGLGLGSGNLDFERVPTFPTAWKSTSLS